MKGPEYAQATRGINVRVASFYLEDQSEPDEGRYVWAYRVTIENHGEQTVQLLSRTWRITDGRGRIFTVEGEGVVGEQPVLEPGEAFEYTSGRLGAGPPLRWPARPENPSTWRSRPSAWTVRTSPAACTEEGAGADRLGPAWRAAA